MSYFLLFLLLFEWRNERINFTHLTRKEYFPTVLRSRNVLRRCCGNFTLLQQKKRNHLKNQKLKTNGSYGLEDEILQ